MTSNGYLEPGDVFMLDGQEWRVTYCNPCRAHCVATTNREVKIRERKFTAQSQRTLDVASNSLVTITRHDNAPVTPVVLKTRTIRVPTVTPVLSILGKEIEFPDSVPVVKRKRGRSKKQQAVNVTGCSRHPKYRGLRYPRAGCKECLAFYSSCKKEK